MNPWIVKLKECSKEYQANKPHKTKKKHAKSKKSYRPAGMSLGAWSRQFQKK